MDQIKAKSTPQTKNQTPKSQSEETPYRMGENWWHLFIWRGISFKNVYRTKTIKHQENK